MSEFKNLPSGWKVVKLGEIGKVINGLTYSPDNVSNNGLLVLRSSNINNNSIVLNNDDVYVKGISKFNKTLENDILICVRNGSKNLIGKSALITEKYKDLAFGVFMAIFRSNYNLFLIHIFKTNTFFKQVKNDLGATINSINNSNLLNFKIPLPPLDEQEKIAEILSTWDEAINLTINLIESKKQLKKALMQNLLTANIRFPQFKDEWEETKLGNIGVFKTSSVDKIIQKDECIVNLVNYMDVYRNTHINSNLKLSQTSASNREIENLSLAKGDVLFTPSSETPDDIGHSAVILSDMPNTLFSYHLVRFRLNIKNDIVFLGYVFNQDKILKQFARLSQGITRYTLSISDFQNVFINFPNLKEQQKIAEILTACDDEINLLNLKLENLKKQKQGLMQKLLKGEIRTCYVKKAM
ncbi:restriction endonuclease subunit S [Campylobacter concisus]|uniref:Type I restriction-modification system, specificity subunit S n=1 Tax=Campylobacter concisus UNSW2 TaxID=1242965 RepID=U2GYN5_9BACT|nr:restriction endonuclease subunit S [Campylobacter concisus]ERJ31063.1 Type I restriction-modification system, specificity subunit S [Campylobacter concisus UNSW2]